MLSERYARQIAFKGIGEEGQEKLGRSKVAVVGLGATGTVIANNLCRAGVGFLRLIDRDYVEITNLQRQAVYDEQDARDNTPKAVAAAEHLYKVNGEVTLEPVVSDVNAGNIEKLIEGMDLVMDGTDNFETRLLINEACHKHRIPWVYNGAIMSCGMSLNILQEEDAPCLRCMVTGVPAPGSRPTCSSAGVLNMITGAVACVGSAEALKILIGSPDIRKNLFVIDVWENVARYQEIEKAPDCPVCGKKQYEFLNTMQGSYTTSLCGRDSVQVVPAREGDVDFAALAQKLRLLGDVTHNRYMLNFVVNGMKISLFRDGRAIIENVRDEDAAKSVYSEYIGL